MTHRESLEQPGTGAGKSPRRIVNAPQKVLDRSSPDAPSRDHPRHIPSYGLLSQFCLWSPSALAQTLASGGPRGHTGLYDSVQPRLSSSLLSSVLIMVILSGPRLTSKLSSSSVDNKVRLRI